jgi:hypothetical protein
MFCHRRARHALSVGVAGAFVVACWATVLDARAWERDSWLFSRRLSLEPAFVSESDALPRFRSSAVAQSLSVSWPKLELSPDLVAQRSLQDLSTPLAAVAAAVAAQPKLTLLDTAPDDRKPGMSVTLQCKPPKCNAIVLARF